MGTWKYQLRLMISQGDYGENVWATIIATLTSKRNRTDLIAHNKKFQFMYMHTATYSCGATFWLVLGKRINRCCCTYQFSCTFQLLIISATECQLSCVEWNERSRLMIAYGEVFHRSNPASLYFDLDILNLNLSLNVLRSHWFTYAQLEVVVLACNPSSWNQLWRGTEPALQKRLDCCK